MVDPRFLSLLTEGMARVFEPCRIPGCRAHSLGFVCGTCARYVCQSHAYICPAVRPQFICASCVIENHRELLTVEDNDPKVVEAEVVG